MTATEWYREHRDHYDKVMKKLDDVRNRFEKSDRETMRDMFLASYEFAVISVQTPVSIHEKAWSAIRTGDADVAEALQEVNYWKNKTKYITESRTKFEKIDEVIDLLREGNIDEAHKVLIDDFLGVGAAKAAFTLAMLGYTSKMCLDTNVKQICELDDVYSGVVVDKYEKCCNQVRDTSEIRPSFLLQWVLFDMNRNKVTSHDVYFNHQLP